MFLPLNLTFGGNKFCDFPESRTAEFLGEFPNFIHAAKT